MSAGNADRPRGRTEDELEHAAMSVKVREAIREYRNKDSLPREFSYSLETGRLYEASKPEDRMILLDHYGNGSSPAYMIAVTNVRGLINDEFAIRAAEGCVQQGRIPFIGRWAQNDTFYEDVSIALNHGISPRLVKNTLIEHDQKAALVLKRTAFAFIYA